LANYSMQNIFKSADSLIEKQKAYGLTKNLVCEKIQSKRFKDGNKTTPLNHQLKSKGIVHSP